MNIRTQLEAAELRITYRALTESALNLRQAAAHFATAGWEVHSTELGEVLLTIEAAMAGIETYSTALGVDL